MPAYGWTCLACSSPNLAATMECATCACPARADLAQINVARLRLGIPEEKSSWPEIFRDAESILESIGVRVAAFALAGVGVVLSQVLPEWLIALAGLLVALAALVRVICN